MKSPLPLLLTALIATSACGESLHEETCPTEFAPSTGNKKTMDEISKTVKIE